MKKDLIYTVLIGDNYDNLIELSSQSKYFDYICFVKKGSEKNDYIGCWRIIELDDTNLDNIRLSRLPKIIPHNTIVKEYGYSLYIDANIDIKDEYIYNRFLELKQKDVKIALLKHPFRDCVYQEGFVCIAACKGSWVSIIYQLIFYRFKGIKKHSGLYEANFIFRKHNDLSVIAMDNLWWNTYMKFSKRDQLSLVYSVTLLKPKIEYFLPPKYTTRNHFALEKVKHNTQKSNVKLNIKKKIVSLFYSLSKKCLKEDM